MRLADANRLLAPGYTDLESGWRRLDDGQFHVAAWTIMPGCTGRMIEWWFGFLRTTEQYKWWHPKDHVWCEWVGEDSRYVGGTHHVHEYIGGELQKLKINFREPATAELAPDREMRLQKLPDRTAEGLLKHCHEEMSDPAGFLPGLYARETVGR